MHPDEWAEPSLHTRTHDWCICTLPFRHHNLQTIPSCTLRTYTHIATCISIMQSLCHCMCVMYCTYIHRLPVLRCTSRTVRTSPSQSHSYGPTITPEAPSFRYILVGECSAFLASGSDPTDERCMKHGPQTSPRRGRREMAACALTERVIASRALTFHRVMHRECAHAFFSCNAYLETLRYVPQTKMLLPAAYAYLELRRTLRHTSTPDIYLYIYIYTYIYIYRKIVPVARLG